MIENLKGHLKTINHHKMLVMKYCFRAGLYRQGLMHDMSKYTPSEFLTGIKYFQGNKSPNTAERAEVGYSRAWLHHKGRNKHHMEYWIDYGQTGDKKMTGIKMPEKYVVEMFCDRIAACKIYNGSSYTPKDPLVYYQKGKEKAPIHEDTKELLEKLLVMLAEEGEDITFSYIRNHLLKN